MKSIAKCRTHGLLKVAKGHPSHLFRKNRQSSRVVKPLFNLRPSPSGVVAEFFDELKPQIASRSGDVPGVDYDASNMGPQSWKRVPYRWVDSGDFAGRAIPRIWPFLNPEIQLDNTLSPRELQTVQVHETTHYRNRDGWLGGGTGRSKRDDTILDKAYHIGDGNGLPGVYLTTRAPLVGGAIGGKVSKIEASPVNSQHQFRIYKNLPDRSKYFDKIRSLGYSGLLDELSFPVGEYDAHNKQLKRRYGKIVENPFGYEHVRSIPHSEHQNVKERLDAYRRALMSVK